MDIRQLNEAIDNLNNKINEKQEISLQEDAKLNEHKIFYYMVEMYRKYFNELNTDEERDAYLKYKEEDLKNWGKDINYAEAVNRFKQLVAAPFYWGLKL